MSEEEIQQTKLKLSKLLDQLGFKHNWIGRRYLTTIVLELIRLRTNGLIENKLGYFYTFAAGKHRTTYSKVECALRYCIDHNRSNIQNHFQVSYKINNKALLELITLEICYL